MSTAPKRHQGRRQRRTDTRRLRERFLIVCEGEKTEPSYFRAFRVNADVQVFGEGKNTISLVEAAKKHEKEKGPFDIVWVVYDKDDFSPDQFNAAAREAEAADFKVAWSNQSFELWYLLHFQYVDSAIHRSQYIERLNQKFPGGYRKNDPRIYDKLLNFQSAASQNAKRLVKFHGNTSPASADPSTRVQDLVAELNAHMKT